MRAVVLAGLCVLASPALADERDERKQWVYEGGWFAPAGGDKWIEMNADAFEKNKGKPFEFKEVKRTAEYVELRSEARNLSVRLTETTMDFKPDDAVAWRTLQKGRWKKPAE
jgi:hypothetical protein